MKKGNFLLVPHISYYDNVIILSIICYNLMDFRLLKYFWRLPNVRAFQRQLLFCISRSLYFRGRCGFQTNGKCSTKLAHFLTKYTAIIASVCTGWHLVRSGRKRSYVLNTDQSYASALSNTKVSIKTGLDIIIVDFSC